MTEILEEVSSVLNSAAKKDYHSALSEANIRVGFIRKVFGILAAQLAMTLVAVIFAMKDENAWLYEDNWTVNILWGVTAAIGIGAMMALCFSEFCSRSVPLNYILLSIFTVSEAYTIGFFTTQFSDEDVVVSLAVTCAVTVTLFLYAMYSQSDITYYGALIFMLSLGGFVLTIICILFPKSFNPSVASFVSAVIYGIYIVYDIQLIIGGHRFEISTDDYIRAALILYFDILRLFAKILEIVGSKKKQD